MASVVIGSTVKDYDKVIYLDAVNGNDTTGNGTEATPFKTITKAYTILHAGTNGLVLKDGVYDIGKFICQNTVRQVDFIGQKEKTSLRVIEGIFSNATNANTGTANLNFYRLIWDGNGLGSATPNFHMIATIWSFYSVVFKNIGDNGFSYFLPDNANAKNTEKSAKVLMYNCIKTTTSTNMLRTANGEIKLTNCYGAFTSGYSTTQASWDYQTNTITQTPSIDGTTYRITAANSIWENNGTGFDQDGTIADRGVWGGAYGWLDGTPATYETPFSFYVKHRVDLTMKVKVAPQNKMTATVGITAVYTTGLSFGATVTRPAEFPFTFAVTPQNRMTAVVNIIPPPTTTSNLVAARDSFVRVLEPRFNFGSRQDMYVGYSDSLNDHFRSFIGFDLNSIPANQNILRATLKVYIQGNQSPFTVELGESNNEWTELGVTWENQPTSYNVLQNKVVTTQSGYVEFDVLEQVKKWYRSEDYNGGFTLRAVDETTDAFIRFFTKENSSYKPILEVEYVDPVIRSFGQNDFGLRATVYRTEKKEVNFSINVRNQRSDADLPIKIRLSNVLDVNMYVSKPVIGFTANVRRNDYKEVPTKVTVRRNGINELGFSVAANRPQVAFKTTVRRSDLKEVPFGITVRQNVSENISFSALVNKPNLPITATVKQIQEIGFTIDVRRFTDSSINTRFTVRQSANKDVPITMTTVYSHMVPMTINVTSGYFPLRIAVPHKADYNKVFRATVRQTTARDLVIGVDVQVEGWKICII